MFSKLPHSSSNDEASSSGEEFASAKQGPHISSSQCLPDPLPQCEPDTTEHQRVLEWHFKDIRMLVGCDLPIFGNDEHPCVSLRLRDSGKPISILTGLDFWLDNLIMNVPEVAMCYHDKDFVEKNDEFKTEELPNLKDSQFSSQITKNTAQHILSFLKEKVIQEGHTYWLFKGPAESDVVKLYNLSNLCSDIPSQPSCNPYTEAVGILLYKMASNMHHISDRTPSGTVRALLDNCTKLLDPQLHSQVFTSAEYLLSNVYVCDDIYKNHDVGNESSDSSSDDTDNRSKKQQITPNPVETQIEETCFSSCHGNRASLPGRHCEKASPEGASDRRDATYEKLAELCEQMNVAKAMRPPPISGTTTERCLQALHHVAKGLECLDRSSATTMPRKSMPVDSWHKGSKMLLLKKAAICYFKLAARCLACNKFNKTLEHLNLALQCLNSRQSLNGNTAEILDDNDLVVAVLAVAADAQFFMRNDGSGGEEAQVEPTEYESILQNSPTGHQTDSDIPQAVLALAVKAYSLTRNDGSGGEEPEVARTDHAIIENSISGLEISSKYSELVASCTDVETYMIQSIDCVQRAVRLSDIGPSEPLYFDLYQRYGIVYNKLGVQDMNKAARRLREAEDKSEDADRVCKQVMRLTTMSWNSLEAGGAIFRVIRDVVNQAVIYCHKGRLSGVCAQAQSVANIGERTSYYDKATENYQLALNVLPRSSLATMRQLITWDLCTTYFNWACLLEKTAVADAAMRQRVELKEVTDLFDKSLKYCMGGFKGLQSAQYQEREASIHHRLASLYHSAYRKQQSSTDRLKRLRELAERHYDKAVGLLQPLRQPCQLLQVQLERIELSEDYLSSLTNATTRLSLMRSILTSLLSDCRSGLTELCATLSSSMHDAESQTLHEASKLGDTWHSRLCATLRNLLRQTRTGNEASLSKKYHSMYSKALQASTTDHANVATKYQRLLDLIDIIQQN